MDDIKTEYERRITNLEKLTTALIAIIEDALPRGTSDACHNLLDGYWESEGINDFGLADSRFDPPFIKR